MLNHKELIFSILGKKEGTLEARVRRSPLSPTEMLKVPVGCRWSHKQDYPDQDEYPTNNPWWALYSIHQNLSSASSSFYPSSSSPCRRQTRIGKELWKLRRR